MAEDIVNNRRAYHNFHIVEKFEAGLELRGTEVKSIRAGKANLNDAFARVDKNEVWLHNSDIQPYEKASHEQHTPRRVRKLLLHRSEIDKLFGFSNVKGNTLVALRLYWKNGKVKVEIGVGKGKVAGDKRADLKKKTVDRETSREVAKFNRSRGS